MGCLVFDKCCCCINLRTGCLIIGYIKLVVVVILTAVSAIAAAGLTAAVVIDAKRNTTLEKSPHLVANGEQDVGKEDAIMAAVFLVILLVVLALVITLLVGLHKGKRGHILAYLIVVSIFVLLYFIRMIIQLVDNHDKIWQVLIDGITNIALDVYFILVIRSYYIKLGEDPKGTYQSTYTA